MHCISTELGVIRFDVIWLKIDFEEKNFLSESIEYT